MHIKIIWVLIIVAVGFPGVNWADKNKTELVLFREVLDPWTLFGKGRSCSDVFIVEKSRDYPGFQGMNNRFCEGEYSLTLDGPPGTTITLYGQAFFGEDRGYLTLTKTDRKRVWIWDLEDFLDGKWMVAEANKDTGAYEVYFHAYPDFKMHLGSAKWNETTRFQSPDFPLGK